MTAGLIPSTLKEASCPPHPGHPLTPVPAPHAPLVGGSPASCTQDRVPVGYRLCSRNCLLYEFVKM